MKISPATITRLLLVILSVAGVAGADDSGGLSFRLGLGYDFVSQEYFLDSLDNPDQGSAVTANLLKREYLDDKKGLLYLKLRPDSGDSYEFEAGWEQTPDLYRAVGRGHLRLGNRDNRVDLDFNMDIKNSFRGTAEAGDNISFWQAQTGFRKRLTEKMNVGLKAFGEIVNFDTMTSITYDYRRLGGEINLNLYRHDFSSVYLAGRMEKRFVPDSTPLEYIATRGIAGYSGYLGKSQLSAEVSLEYKNYNGEYGGDDYLLAMLYANLALPLDYDNYLKFNISLEKYDFSDSAVIGDDYARARSVITWERDLSPVTLSVGPGFETARIASDYTDDDDYFEYFLQTGFDLFATDKWLVLLENQVGYRNYFGQTPDDSAAGQAYLSDFHFDRISLIGSVKIYRALSFDILFSAEWEWHREETDDLRLYLLSAGLDYSF